MAPELAISAIENAPKGPILDPMCGSGTVLRASALAGRQSYGLDMDPLAVLMSRVWTTPLPQQDANAAATRLIGRAKRTSAPIGSLPWIDRDSETREFIEYWFADKQRLQLRRLARLLHAYSGMHRDVFRLALSRTIVTKDRGVSLARDVSHSRPHRVMDDNDIDVYDSFLRSVDQIAKRLSAGTPTFAADVRLGDARELKTIESSSIAAVVTSPPYLNAIDYLRGHRLALVWLGWTVSKIRRIRSSSIGAERRPDRALDSEVLAIADDLVPAAPTKLTGMFRRYALDMASMATEAERVLAPGGHAVFVVGNSTVRGTFVDNATLTERVCHLVGLHTTNKTVRDLPDASRYLPPPAALQETGSLAKRMRTETVLTLEKTG